MYHLKVFHVPSAVGSFGKTDLINKMKGTKLKTDHKSTH